MRRIRALLFWLHLACGVSAGIVILIMSVTGVALTYQRQMQLWADTRHYQATPPPDARRRPVAELIAAAAADHGPERPTTVTVRSEPSAPAAVSFGSRTLYVDPYTAEVRGEATGAWLRSFFQQMTVWHRYLAMSGDSRATGRAITGVSNLLFLFIVLSGVYLWWPRSLTWVQFRQVLWFRRASSSKARDFNWHNVMGFWSAIPLALVVYSGVVISYPWASNMVYRAVGEQPPAVRGARAAGPARSGGPGARGRGAGPAGPVAAAATAQPPAAAADAGHLSMVEASGTSLDLDLDRVLDRAAAAVPGWRSLAIRLPAPDDDIVSVSADRGHGGQPQLRSTITVDAVTLAVRSTTGFETQTAGQRARSFLRFVHTGEYFGVVGQTIAGLVSAAGAVLVYTGLALSARRWLAWRRRRQARPGPLR